METDPPLSLLGNAGRGVGQGRDSSPVQPIGEDPETGDPIFPEPPQPSKTIPANCLRVLSSPITAGRGGGCGHDCEGLTDGVCVAETVRRAQAAGISDWQFDVSYDPFGNRVWTYAGPPLPEEEA